MEVDLKVEHGSEGIRKKCKDERSMKGIKVSREKMKSTNSRFTINQGNRCSWKAKSQDVILAERRRLLRLIFPNHCKQEYTKLKYSFLLFSSRLIVDANPKLNSITRRYDWPTYSVLVACKHSVDESWRW